MKKEYKYYLEKIKTLKVRETSEIIGVSEDLIRKYFRGETYPRLPNAVTFEVKFKIPCSFWVEHYNKTKTKDNKNERIN